ncbi:GNAT family N-acetyltransferase [Shewanella phaeophyticola]|uniref:GNAT family N-acetyltransferase n=1 Tax=Shewanella phaeophyticola TaxID=2978345 RepID=A0ABT2P7T1_9GAMM|nr:GNAT family N-acetyltransferase [Shewanella sp. KJ10-1]MCT8987430.1 GNAT family N-acetyltransferase [Shewanella sp. KJ10-1]
MGIIAAKPRDSLNHMSIRPIIASDWPAIMAIQAQCYIELIPESLEVMQSKWQASPTTCLVVEQAQHVVAYALVHPWAKGNAPSLDTEIAHNESNSWYLHDMAISPAAQGMGLGKQLLEHVINQATQLSKNGIGLVAVQGAKGYWQQQGFLPEAPSESLNTALNTYPPDACYLYLTLD